MKIQLQSLRVVNCGPLRDDCIQFNTIGDSPTTVLAGANGSGKTTILESLFEIVALIDWSSPPRQIDRVLHADLRRLEMIVDDEPVYITASKLHIIQEEYLIFETAMALSNGGQIMFKGDKVNLIEKTIAEQTKLMCKLTLGCLVFFICLICAS